MRVLFVGDIVGRKARNFAQKKIFELKDQLQLDAVIVNVENAAGGFGVTPNILLSTAIMLPQIYQLFQEYTPYLLFFYEFYVVITFQG